MSLLDELTQKYAASDLSTILTTVGLTGIDPDRYEELKQVTLAQWLLESARATSKLAVTATNFAGLKWREEMGSFATKINLKVPSEPAPTDFCQFSDIDAFILGYWKFLTREPYQGLEKHTNTPENFIGFLHRSGFAADIRYVSKVINLVPEARELFLNARGISIPAQPNELKVTSFPQEVATGQNFTLKGTASPSDRGELLSILIDGEFPGDPVEISENGDWRIDFIFKQAGARKMKITLGTQSEEIVIKAIDTIEKSEPEETIRPLGSIVINLSGSVGSGGVNKASEVIAVKKRLHDLGFTWVGDPSSASLNTGFINAIKLFQSIIAGESRVKGDGRVDLAQVTHRWLQASNAPVWKTMPDSDSSINFVNFEKEQTGDDHDFGTSWLADTILKIARDYNASSPGSAPFSINDVSRPQGGDTPDHAGHETGLMCDVLLPRTDGRSGGIEWSSSSFDRNAARKLIQAMRKQTLVRAVFFNDPTLRGEGLCSWEHGHDNHIHFEINPPVRS